MIINSIDSVYHNVSSIDMVYLFTTILLPGTSDPVPNDYTFKYCPCETTTDVCYPAVPPKSKIILESIYSYFF